MDYLGEDTYPAPPEPESTPQPAPQPNDNPLTPQSPTHTPSQPDLRQYIASPYVVNPNDPYDGMPPPPEDTYDDLPTLMRACQDHGRRYGYACVTSSNNYKRGIAYVRCDRGGEYVNHWKVTPETRIRKNRTRRLVGCKWKARAKRTAEGGWQLTMMEDKHNGHGPSGDLSQHPSLRQLPEEAVDEAKQAFQEGRTPKEVLERLKAWNQAVTPQDVYNLKAKISRKDTADAKGTPVRGARLRGSGGPGTNGTNDGNGTNETPQAENADAGLADTGMGGDGFVDPALRAHESCVSNIAQLTAAVAQMQEPEAPAIMGDPARKACECKCCEH